MEKRKTTEAAKSVKTQPENDYILELKNITKTFLGGKIIANNDISLSFKRNEIHAIVGENGSGKSTLMNIIFGLYKQDKGDIFFNKEKVNMFEPGAAKKYKVGMVHQHFHIIESFSVLDNVILGQEKINKSDEIINSLKEEILQFDEKIEKNNIDLINETNDIFNSIDDRERNISKYKNLIKETKKSIKRLNIEKQSKKLEKLNNELNNLNEKLKNETEFLDSELKNYNIHESKNKRLYKNIKSKREVESKLADLKTVGKFGFLVKKNLLKRFKYIQSKYKISLDPYAKVSTLSVGQRQMVEILKVLWDEKEIIVFDEPTATLSIIEIESLLKTIKALKKEGKTIIFISHKLQEVKEISDRISILRKGVMTATHKNDSKLKPSTISKEMVGRVVKLDYPERKVKGKNIIEFKDISYRTKSGFKALDNVSFSIKEGEIFGLAGIEGNGQEEIIKVVTDLSKPSSGEIFYKGELVTNNSGYKVNGKTRRKIMSHVPIDRLKYGVVPVKDLEFNARISDFDTKFFKANKISEFTDKIIEDFNVEGAFNHSVQIRNLSGGNQQKFIVGREMLRNHSIYIAGHPTRGLDISAIDIIYKKMIENSKNKATLLYSLEISELISVCDRIAIMYKGKIVNIINPKKVSIEDISRMMIGEVV